MHQSGQAPSDVGSGPRRLVRRIRRPGKRDDEPRRFCPRRAARRARGIQPFAWGALAAIVPALALWGFTVDDALIPARYAAHIAQGKGYVFNAGRAVTDGVTPLGFPYLLAPFASGGVLQALAFARIFGALSWFVGAALVGAMVSKVEGARARWLALLVVLCSAPLGAWCSAGLETGVVTALVAVALYVKHVARAGDVLPSIVLGIAGAMRPECLPMALMVAFGSPRATGDAPPPRLSGAHFVRVFSALAPFVGVAIARLVLFGRPAPLSVYAKPPSGEYGVSYAAACFVLCGPVALLAPIAWKKIAPDARALVAGVGVHFVAIAFAGGDWMPVSRLAVPVMPVVAVAAAHVLAVSHRIVGPLRLGVALAGEVFTLVKMHASLRRVMEDRVALMRDAAPYLQGRKAIGALDIGWIGAVTESTVVDFAGVTDPFVASLPGTHTSKPIPDAFVDAVGIDTLVLLVKPGQSVAEEWTASTFDRGVERYVALGPGIRESFDVVHVTDVAEGRLRYVIAYRRPREATASSVGLERD